MAEVKDEYHRPDIESAVRKLVDAREFVEDKLGTKVFGEHNPVPVIQASIQGLNDADDVLKIERQIQARILGPVETEFSSFSSQLRRNNIWAWGIGLFGILCTVALGAWSVSEMRENDLTYQKVVIREGSTMAAFKGSLSEEVDLKEAMNRLEYILGKHEDDNQELWQSKASRRTPGSMRPGTDGEQSSIHLMKDISSLGTPYRIGVQIAFDSYNLRSAWEFEDKDEKKPIWVQQRHSVDRYLLKRTYSGAWFVQRISLSHSNPSQPESVYSLGTVVWGEDEIELVMFALDATLTSDGKMSDLPITLKTRIKRTEDLLSIESSYRYYDFLKNEEGTPLPLPNMNVPLSGEFSYSVEMKRGVDSSPAS